MKGIASGRVVYNDGVSHGSARESHILDKNTLEESAVLSEESVVDHLLGLAVQYVNQRISIFAQTGCVDN